MRPRPLDARHTASSSVVIATSRRGCRKLSLKCILSFRRGFSGHDTTTGKVRANRAIFVLLLRCRPSALLLQLDEHRTQCYGTHVAPHHPTCTYMPLSPDGAPGLALRLRSEPS